MALEVDIRKRLGDFQLDVRFESGGGVMGLLGASGCGKSMTLKCIAGIETPDEGSIVLDGRVLFDAKRRVNLSPQRRRVGYLFQQYALFPTMTVARNIGCGVADRARRGEIVARWVAAVRLTGLEGKYPAQLSGGQQQRVALARILANEPEALLLDEPFSALDSYLRWQLEMEVADVLREYGRTTLFVSHSRDEVYRLCDRVCVINEGTSEAATTVQALFERPRTFSAALLSGCKNYSEARRAGDGRYEALDWGITLRVQGEGAETAGEPADCLGIRSHSVALAPGAGGENTLPCRITRIQQDVFSAIIMLRPLGARDTAFASIRMDTDKKTAQGLREGGEVHICLDPAQLMPLRKEAGHDV